MTKRNRARGNALDLHNAATAALSPLVLCDHLIQVALEADRAGYVQTAAHLMEALERMFDTPAQHH
jgi:hypothetical protein